MSENKKNVNQTNEIKDEELDAVSGGLSRRPKQQQMKQCAMDGCTNQIPEDRYPAYCDACLERMRREGVNPIL